MVHNCYADTEAAVVGFVTEYLTGHALAAKLVGWFFLCAAFYGLFKATMAVIGHVRGLLRMLVPGANVKKLGEWAVVTGATDGIGKGYAFELARQGMNIVLISRTQSKLDAVKSELLAKYPNVQATTVAVDFSNFDEAKQNDVKKAVDNLDIGVLVNNVGMSYSRPHMYLEASLELTNRLIEVNLNSMTRMTYIVLPGMVSRRRGSIVNVSSGAGSLPQPLQAVYGGCKNFVNSFSESLDLEYRSKGVRVSSQAPMFVVSNLSKIRRSSFFVPSATAFARAAVAKIGTGETYVLPYWTHRLQFCLYSLVPRWILQKGALNMHLSIRKRAIRKEERVAAAANADKTN